MASCDGSNPNSKVGSNAISGRGVVRQENTIEFNGFTLQLTNGSQYDIRHVDERFKKTGLIVEFEGTSRNEALPAGVPQKIDFDKLAIVGIEN